MLSQIDNLLTSSTGEGLALRVKSFVALVLPLLVMLGVPLVSTEVDKFIEAGCYVLFACLQAFAWIRRTYYKQNNLGAFKKK